MSRSSSLLARLRPLLVTSLVAAAASAAVAQDRAPATAPKQPDPTSQNLGNRSPATPTAPAADKGAAKEGEKAPAKEGEKPAADASKGAALEYVQMSTSMGTVIIELNREKAPISVENFLSYVDSGFYAGTIFHRVIPTFVIQGGGFTADMKQKPTEKPIKNECTNGLTNVRGSLSMARTQDPDSATSQFFINVADNIDGTMNNLDHPVTGVGYAVFGRVYAGMDVVDAIKDVATGSVKVDGPRGPMPMSNVPKQPVLIVKMSRISAEEAKKAAAAAPKAPAAAPAAPATPAAPAPGNGGRAPAAPTPGNGGRAPATR